MDRERRLERGGGPPEDGEELIGACVDLETTRRANARPDQPANVAEQGGVVIAETLQQAGRPFDVGEQEGHRPARERPHRRRARLPKLPVEEAERHDAVLLGSAKEPFAGTLPRDVVLEIDLVKAREGVSHVRCVVDRQTASALRIDVRESTVGEARAGGGVERWHGFRSPRRGK